MSSTKEGGYKMLNLTEKLVEKGLPATEVETQPKKPQYIAKGVARLVYLPKLWRPSHAGVVMGRYREAKPFGLIIRAKWNEHRIGPEALIEHKVFWLVKTGKDKHGNTRPYLRFYGRQNDQNNIDTNLYVFRFQEKAVGAGATASRYVENGTVEYDTGPLFSGAGANWEHHIVVTCRDDITPNAGVLRKGPTGKTWFEKII